MTKLKVEYLSTEDLRPYADNAKIHTAEQVEQIKESIREFGMNDPIAIWKNNEIIEGHGRLIACSELGIEQVPVIRLDGLTDEQRKAYMLVHNQLTMNTGFDETLLNIELEKIGAEVDMTQFGFEIREEVEEPEEVKGEIPFTEILGEESNYVVLQFKNDIDWLYAKSVLGIQTVESTSTRKDGKIIGKMHRYGVGRVLDGAETLKRLLGD